MTAADTVALVHLLGFVTSGALYALLGLMVARRATDAMATRHATSDLGRGAGLAAYLARNRLALATAVLGVLWNAGALVFYGQRDLGVGSAPPAVAAAAFAALGLLPAVVVHAALLGEGTRTAQGYVVLAYVLSGGAALLHALDAARGLPLPSRPALLALTAGYLVLTAGLALQHRRFGGRRTIGAIGLAVFAVSALHLGQHGEGGESWLVALVGHQASLPLALVILYQDYRFALADVFLKRALALVALVGVALGLLLVAAPVLGDLSLAGGTRAVAALIALWIATALVYPTLRRGTALLVDRVLLRRPDYAEVRGDVARRLEAATTVDGVLDAARDLLAGALGADHATWRELRDAATPADALLDRTRPARDGATARIPTAEPPAYAIVVGALAGGRRLLSDDLALLESVALLAGRRVDAIRVADERTRRDVREAEVQRLASEAELHALRAQLDPHFLFNTLNTLGYLMDVDAGRARATLRNVSDLLRAVLARSRRGLCTLGEEVELVRAYLAIEEARFEERLQATLDVPEALRGLLVPPLILQPLVENAVKHGIAPRRAGGAVTVTARVEAGGAGEERVLRLTVRDTGAGASDAALRAGRARGVGLENLERRLARYYGETAGLRIASAADAGTTAEVWLPASRGAAADDGPARARAGGAPPEASIAPDAATTIIDPSRAPSTRASDGRRATPASRRP